MRVVACVQQGCHDLANGAALARCAALQGVLLLLLGSVATLGRQTCRGITNLATA